MKTFYICGLIFTLFFHAGYAQEIESAIEKVRRQNKELKLQNEALREKLEKLDHTIRETRKELESDGRKSKLVIKPVALYDNARRLFENRDYDASRKSFQIFIEIFPGHNLGDNAQYWIGECHYSAGDYEKAGTAFRKVIENFKGGNKSADAMFKMGMCYHKLDDTEKARECWQSVIKEFPRTRAAALSKKRLRKR